ncbi:hypothetical protein DFH05DRAFT_481752 [Lentinula detonsa]|uniref:Uncharacterized protein n=1 Tax=Lentinula detonsa TaxID=2804962 RepID=A0A9W8TTJ2_9AGAR|nr:hypothetical protein DFH05DRAFT_481752 [Lentinula detonsa]
MINWPARVYWCLEFNVLVFLSGTAARLICYHWQIVLATSPIWWRLCSWMTGLVLDLGMNNDTGLHKSRWRLTLTMVERLLSLSCTFQPLARPFSRWSILRACLTDHSLSTRYCCAATIRAHSILKMKYSCSFSRISITKFTIHQIHDHVNSLIIDGPLGDPCY